MFDLINKSRWYAHKSKRLGRGNASKWNYSGRWIKWQKSRSWYSKNPGFEGGQTPLNKRLPKYRWFKRYFKLIDNYQIVNLDRLEADDRIKDTIDKSVLKELWYISYEDGYVKVLWEWDLSKKITFSWIEKFSKSAKDKIEKAWGKIE